MAKSRVNLTIDPYTHEKAKDAYDSFSQRVQELVEADLDVQNINDPELIKNEIQSKEQELESVEEDLEALREKKERLETDLNTARATLEKKQREQEEKQDKWSRFEDIYSQQDWNRPEDIPDYWKNELGMEKTELMEEVKA